MLFTIDTDNNITALDAAPVAQEGLVAFATEKEFAKASNGWTIGRLVEIWNGFAGVAPFSDLKPVKKFENREKATRRIWAAIQKLVPELAAKPDIKIAPKPEAKETAKANGKATQPPAAIKKTDEPASEAKTPREGTAKATVLAMIQREGGATLDEIVTTTGWQKHTVRGFLSVVPKKAGLTVTSTRRESDKARVYEAK